MRLEGEVFCEGPECEAHWHAGVTRFHNRTLVSLPPEWLLVSQFSEQPVDDLVFCGRDCCMKWCAQFDPPEIL